MTHETTIENYKSVVGALAENTIDTPHDIVITDIENLTKTNLHDALFSTPRFVNISFKEGSIWKEVDATSMFSNCTVLISIDTSPFKNVRKADGMFDGCLFLKSIDTSGFISLNSAINMFASCGYLKSINTEVFSYVLYADEMFRDCSLLTEVDTSGFIKVSTGIGMFANCTSLKSIDSTPFQSLVNAKSMFSGCENLTFIDASGFINVTNAFGMFYGCTSLQTIDVSELSNVTEASNIFGWCKSLKSVYYTAGLTSQDLISEIPSDKAVVKGCVVTVSDYPTVVSSLAENTVDTPYNVMILDPENLYDGYNRFIGRLINEGNRYVNLSFKEGSVYGDSYGKNFVSRYDNNCLLLVSFDSSPFVNVTVAEGMFDGCRNLKSVTGAGFSKVSNALDMFRDCRSLEYIDTSAFTAVRTAEGMFGGCQSLETIDTSSFKNVTNAHGMFWACRSLTSIYTTVFEKVTNIGLLFGYCTSLEKVCLCNMPEVTETGEMFLKSFPEVHYLGDTISDAIKTELESYTGIKVDGVTCDEYSKAVPYLPDNTPETPYNINIIDPENIATISAEGE